MADYAGCGWTTIFKMGGKAMALPEELTRVWWDKKKQLVAKTHATGIGDELEKLKKAFTKIEWFWLSARPDVMRGDVERAKKFMTSSDITALRNQLKVVRDLAKSEAAVMKKGALTKKTGDVLLEMSAVADHLFVATNPASLSTALADAIKDWDLQIKAKFIKLAQPTLDAVKLVNDKLPAVRGDIQSALKGFIANPQLEFGGTTSRDVLGQKLRDLCRDMTQPLGNLGKSHKAGVPFTNFDAGAISSLFDEIEPLANSKSHGEFIDGLEVKEVAQLVGRVDAWAASFLRLTKNIAIA